MEQGEQVMMREVLEIPAEVPEEGIIRRDGVGRYLPGQSGNPSGLPGGADQPGRGEGRTEGQGGGAEGLRED